MIEKLVDFLQLVGMAAIVGICIGAGIGAAIATIIIVVQFVTGGAG